MRKIAILLIVVALNAVGTMQQARGQEMALTSNLLYDATSTINLGYEVALGRKTTLDIWVNYNPWTLGNKWVGLYENEMVIPSPSASKRDVKLKHLLIQPEVRWWTCEKFNGHFFGVHLHGGAFNVGALKLPFGIGRYKNTEGKYLGTYPVQMTPVGHSNLTVQGIAYEPSRTAYPGLGEGANETNDKYLGFADSDGIFVNSYEGWFAGAGVSYGYHWILAPRFSLEFTLGVGYAYIDYQKNRCTDCVVKLDEGIKHYFGPTRAGITLVFMLK